jgi:hypothetical protein
MKFERGMKRASFKTAEGFEILERANFLKSIRNIYSIQNFKLINGIQKIF